MNPFDKRATEYYRDDVAFLQVVTPEPLNAYFASAAAADELFDRLVTVIGTPGSGKTTMARLFQFSVIRTVLRQVDSEHYRDLLYALRRCRAIVDDMPGVAGYRLPLEAEYRDLWELPYKDEVKFSLMRGLLQARAVLGWMRSFEASGIPLDQITIVPRADAEAATAAIGGTQGPDLLRRAQEVEQAIYKVSAALIAPKLDEIKQDEFSAYRPFDVITQVQVREKDKEWNLRPLIMFDDAHSLHPRQFDMLLRWLVQRELRVARWVLSRLDALSPEGVLLGPGSLVEEDEALPGVQRGREIKVIALQGNSLGDNRTVGRKAFRRMAKDMANRYLAQMPTFTRKRITEFASLLQSAPDTLPPAQLEKLRSQVEARCKRLTINSEERDELEKQIRSYLSGAEGSDTGPDVELAMLRILLARYATRRPQVALFDKPDDEEGRGRPLKADSSVAEGARVQLYHEYKRPLFYGIDTLCDAGSENAEQFLRLAAGVVDRSETLLIRERDFTLSPRVQNELLRNRADAIIREWNFPYHPQVRALCEAIGKACLDRTLLENAPLGAGANGVGVSEEEFEKIPSEHPELARVMQYGVAYQAFSLVRNRAVKDRRWCIIELSGVLAIHFGLTLQRGGFVEWQLGSLIDSAGLRAAA